jgi:3D (Asp-Asp-Asp) domain-containing protein
MTKPANNQPAPHLLKRVAHVTLVALCTASSLALLGAVPAQWGAGGRNVRAPKAIAASGVAKPVVYAAPPLMALSPAPEQTVKLVELLKPVPATPPAPLTRVIRMEVTAYCACVKCCGPKAQGITASGKPVTHNGGRFVAADTSVLPFGKKIVVPGYADGEKVQVLDRGGAIKGNKLDLFFASHDEARAWGRQQLDVTVYE